MKSLILVFLSLAAFAAAIPTRQNGKSGVYVQYFGRRGIQCRSNCQSPSKMPHNDCPVVDCPPAVRDGVCGEPDCSLPGNRLRLHPTTDPNFFYQCVPLDAWGNVGPLRRKCACGTLFSATYDDTRCVHPEEWIRDCPTQPEYPELDDSNCTNECFTCGDGDNDGDDDGHDDDDGHGDDDDHDDGKDDKNKDDDDDKKKDKDDDEKEKDEDPKDEDDETPGNNCPCPCVCLWIVCQPCPSTCACNGTNNNANTQWNNQRPAHRPW